MNRRTQRSADRFGSDSSPFLLDLRAIGLFRVLLAVTILMEQFIRLAHWSAFNSASGLVSAADSRAWDTPWLWSVYWISDGPLLPVLLEGLRFLSTLTLLLGIRSRLSAFVLFVLLASLATRNPLLLQGGDKVLIVMTFFAMFLPLGQWGSLERSWFGSAPTPGFRSAATVAFVIQVLLVWFMGGIHKTGEQWWSSGTAISMALHLEAFASEFARLWRGWDGLVQPLTFLVFWLECLAPLLALIPRYWCRITGLFALVALEIGIWMSLEVGLFPMISLVSLVPLVPSRLIDTVAIRWPRRANRPESELILFFDRDCRFCAFACRVLISAGGLRDAQMREAQTDPVAEKILEDLFAWSVAIARRSSRETAPAQPKLEYRQGWEAVRFFLQHSRRPWLLRILPGPSRGDRIYAWIGRHRGAFGTAGRACFGRNPEAGWHGPFGRFVATLALICVLAWNVVSYPAIRDWRDYRPFVLPLVSTLNLLQYWNMFAPYPYRFDNWHVMPGLTRDGRTVDVLSGRALELLPPRDGPGRYGSYRWRKVIFRSLQIDRVDRVFGFFCRTGDWAAIDLWEFSRPNLGTGDTANSAYEVDRVGRWICAGVDERRVDHFRGEIDAQMMERYRRARHAVSKTST